MRVLHVTDCYLPRLGGIEVHVSNLAAHQRAEGADARVVTLTDASLAVPDPPWVVRVGREPGRPADRGVSALSADTHLRDLLTAWVPDVVHVHVSVFSPFATLAARRAAASGLPTLVTVHSMWSRLGPLPGVARVLLQLRRWPVQWSAVSDAAARPLREMLGPELEVAVLPNAVAPAAWRPPSVADAPADVGDRSQDPTLVSVMRFTRTKRALPLARMLLQVREALPERVALRAVVIGDGPQLPSFGRFLARHDMSGWVDLPGRLSQEAVCDQLARSDVFVAPATLESFGIAALEARAAGLPVVASARSGIGEFVREGRDGLLAADDRAMVRAMVRLVTDSTLREAIRAHNLHTPVSHDWPAASARTRVLYDQARAVARSRGPLARTVLA
ncbi:MAG: glycosyltransferase family 4 protein [Nocardioides sp.]|nr:glycosyltransferase family 4 protein [Nocardioides sp.]